MTTRVKTIHSTQVKSNTGIQTKVKPTMTTRTKVTAFLLIYSNLDEYKPKGNYPGENVQNLGLFDSKEKAMKEYEVLKEDYENAPLRDDTEENAYFDVREMSIF